MTAERPIRVLVAASTVEHAERLESDLAALGIPMRVQRARPSDEAGAAAREAPDMVVSNLPLSRLAQETRLGGLVERWRLEEAARRSELHASRVMKIEAIGRLAGGIAHDFNNLLSVIEGQAERLLGEIEQDDPRRQRVLQIIRSAERAAALTSQLLAFGRRQVLEPRVLRLGGVAVDARRMLERVLGDRIALAVEAPAELDFVRTDPRQIVQVLLHLAANARDAMPDGGRMTIRFENVELDEGFAESHPPCTAGRYVLMAIDDTGPGMDAEAQNRAFEPFFTTKTEGQGLGLATVYGIVKQSGGFIWIRSQVGRGTSFDIYFPVVPPTTEAEHPVAGVSAAVAGHRGARILLVEDDDGVRAVMAELLKDQGYSVAVAAHPAEALTVMETLAEPIDLLLTDIIMPGMTGQELAQQLKERQPTLRVLYVSGYAGEGLTRSGGVGDAERFLQKPFTAAAFLQSVRDSLAAGP